MKDPLYLLDGYSLIYASFYALSSMGISGGVRETAAIHGFCRFLWKLLKERHPTHLVVAMDSPTPLLKHELYTSYKANRERPPEGLFKQVAVIEEILAAMGISSQHVDGYEADDIIGTLVARCLQEGRGAYIISRDKDLLQLVSDKVSILEVIKGKFHTLGPAEVFAKKGVYPDQIVDYLTMVGDASDNIPGLPGIGVKTAAKLLGTYGSLEAIYQNLEELPSSSQQAKFREGKPLIHWTRKIIALEKDLPLSKDPAELHLKGGDWNAACVILEREGLRQLASLFGENALKTPPLHEGSRAFAEGRYQTITTQEALASWVSRMTAYNHVAVDCTMASTDLSCVHPVGISLSVEEGEACYIPLKGPATTPLLPASLVECRLRSLFSDTKITIISQNVKNNWKLLSRWGFLCPPPFFDTTIAAWVLDSDSPVSLTALARKYLDYTLTHDKAVSRKTPFDGVPLDQATTYAAEQADITLRLFHRLLPLLQERGLLSLCQTLEFPLALLLAHMEMTGIRLDTTILQRFGEQLTTELKALKEDIYALCGKSFNIRSPQQLQQILFVERKLPPQRKTKTGFSTDTAVLMELAQHDPLPKKIVTHRVLTKLQSAYVEALPKRVNPQTGRIHTTFVGTGTATGRLSSRDPNLQAIPIHDENGRKIRRAFLPDPGSVFLSADYAQIELVILAHLSEDPTLSRAFLSGADIHKETASLLFKVPIKEVTPRQRQIAKTINFSVIYGMSSFRLAKELDISRNEADHFITSYFARYPSISTFIENTVQNTVKTGKVTTLLGRERLFPLVKSPNRTERIAAERAAVNSRIQGSAADIVKVAMLKIESRLRKEKLATSLLLQIHDECLLESPEKEVPQVRVLLKEEMESALSLSVPLQIHIHEGRSWGDAH